jgi:hypothetical protein
MVAGRFLQLREHWHSLHLLLLSRVATLALSLGKKRYEQDRDSAAVRTFVLYLSWSMHSILPMLKHSCI